MTNEVRDGAARRRAGVLVAVLLLATYLVTGGGHGYSVDGAFGYEMAKTVFLDPEHSYFKRFKTAFARWGALMPALGQPLVVAGDALSYLAPERDSLFVDGHEFRVEEWPVASPGQPYLAPLPSGGVRDVAALAVISFLANGRDVLQGTTVAEVRLTTRTGSMVLPIRAGIETAEWALDRPDMRGAVQHGRPRLAGHWIGQPRGNLYFARLLLPDGTDVTRMEIAAVGSGGAGSAPWNVRAAAFQRASGLDWADIRTDARFWSSRQTHDFFARLLYATLNAFTTAATAWLVFALAGLFGFSVLESAVAALGFGLATMAWPYARLDFSEPASTAFSLLAVWAFYRAFPPVHFRLITVRAAVFLGLLAAGSMLLAVAGKYTAALLGAALLLQWALSSGWWRRDGWRRSAAFLAACLLPALGLGVLVIAVAFALTGEMPIVLVSGTSRLQDDWLALPLWTGLRGLLFSPGKSLFLYSPWLLLAIPGAVLLVRRFGRHATLFAVFPVVVVLLYSMKLVWHGGSWGPRYLLPIVPLLCVAALPAIRWCLAHAGGRAILIGLAVVSVAVQGLGIAKDPAQYPAMVREFVVPGLPDLGSRLGGRDYWLARGGDGLPRALQDPSPAAQQRGLGYLWGYPDARLLVEVKETRAFSLSLYFVDWDRQHRRQTVTVEDALGQRTFELDADFDGGVWATWQVTATPIAPLRVTLRQRGADTAVVSAAAFGPRKGDRAALPDLDAQTRGNWRGSYGADGYVLFAFRSFNVDASSLPVYVQRYELSNVGDRPEPRIHVEIAEQDVLDTPLLYALPFSPLLGNAWLLAADLARLVIPARPDITAGILWRPPWTWFGIEAPRPEHPEYGLGIDFWPALLYNNYASHPAVLVAAGAVLLALQAGLLWAAAKLLALLAPSSPRAHRTLQVTLAAGLIVYDWLQISA